MTVVMYLIIGCSSETSMHGWGQCKNDCSSQDSSGDVQSATDGDPGEIEDEDNVTIPGDTGEDFELPPGTEQCNGLDDDGNGQTDEEGAAGCVDYYYDGDGDGWGTGVPLCLCQPTAHHSTPLDGDCIDSAQGVNPGAEEDCFNAVDDDCDGVAQFVDCSGKACGDDGCGGSCGTCPAGEECEDGVCVGDGPEGCDQTCTEAAVECGSIDGCDCGECPGNQFCAWTGVCALTCNPMDYLGPHIQKANLLDVGYGGAPGQGLDVDHDPATCAPADDCGSGVDNQLSGVVDELAGLYDLRAVLADRIAEGNIVVLTEYVVPDFSGKPFVLNVYWGDTTAERADCDYQTQVCDYLLYWKSFDASGCQPVATFDNARIIDGVLTAGGMSYEASVSIDMAGVMVPLVLRMAHVKGEIPGWASSDLHVEGGILAAGIPKQALIDIVENTPEEDLPVDKGLVLGMFDLLLVNDLDSDGDGSFDSISVGFIFATIPGNVVGLK